MSGRKSILTPWSAVGLAARRAATRGGVKTTPAMASGLIGRVWTVKNIVSLHGPASRSRRVGPRLVRPRRPFQIMGLLSRLGTPPMSDQPPDSTSILVVEDQDEVREMIVRSLVQEGYRVVQARDGVQALALLGSDPRTDLVITDMGMPNMGGLTLARRAALVARPPVLLFISGYDQNPAEIPGALLVKPFGPDMLLDEVRRCLRHRN